MLKNRFTLRNRGLAAVAATALALGSLAAAGCGDDDDEATNGATAEGGSASLSGTVVVDGSSTVAPLGEAAAEFFQNENSGVRVTVGTSGTGGGFEKFCRGEIDIAEASRPIAEDEIAACGDAGITFEQIGVANDGIAVAVNVDNDWASCLTVDQLNSIWDRDSEVSNWNEVDPSFPDESLSLYGPGTDSGTFDYFTDAINGEEGNIRTDYNNIGEDDNAAITGVSGSRGGMAFIPLSFVEENSDAVKAIGVDGGEGCVEPRTETVSDGSYSPLGRQLFIYPSGSALERPEVQAFVEYFINESDTIADAALFVPLTEEQKTAALDQVAALTQ
ncbi:MAG: PstS family phosphate ABC transporter substrate-binding protein [Miltoncostaeaceae bacterium]